MSSMTPAAEQGLGEALALEDRIPDLDGGSLRRHTARGVIINAVFQIGLAVLTMTRRFAVAIFLTPAELGVWGIAIITVMTLFFIKNSSISDKFVQQSEGDQEAAFQKAFTFELSVTGRCFVDPRGAPAAGLRRHLRAAGDRRPGPRAAARRDRQQPPGADLGLLPADGVQAPAGAPGDRPVRRLRRHDRPRRRRRGLLVPRHRRRRRGLGGGGVRSSRLPLQAAPALRPRQRASEYFSFSWPLFVAGGRRHGRRAGVGLDRLARGRTDRARRASASPRRSRAFSDGVDADRHPDDLSGDLRRPRSRRAAVRVVREVEPARADVGDAVRARAWRCSRRTSCTS